jgi:hypothetical protein
MLNTMVVDEIIEGMIERHGVKRILQKRVRVLYREINRVWVPGAKYRK